MAYNRCQFGIRDLWWLTAVVSTSLIWTLGNTKSRNDGQQAGFDSGFSSGYTVGNHDGIMNTLTYWERIDAPSYTKNLTEIIDGRKDDGTIGGYVKLRYHIQQIAKNNARSDTFK